MIFPDRHHVLRAAVLSVLALALSACGTWHRLWHARDAAPESAIVAAHVPPDRPHDYRDRNFDYFVSGDPTLPRAAKTEFGLSLMGGGGNVDAAFQFIASHAGFGHIVILRATSDAAAFDPGDGNYGERFFKQWGPVVSAETFVFKNREAASDARVLAALASADGIFLAGGDQSRYIRYWKGTPVQTALNAHVAANRPIGGSSAGLAILGHYSYSALDGGSMESLVAEHNPYDKGMTLESDFLHFATLENVVTDTHFGKRARLGRLIAFVARFNKDDLMADTGPDTDVRAGTKIFGLGLDEKTALLINSDGIGHIAAGSAGSAWLVAPLLPAEILLKGVPLTIKNIQLTRIGENSSVDLKTHAVTQPAAEATVSIKAGLLSEPSIATPIFSRNLLPRKED